jgi:hypothetical protein
MTIKLFVLSKGITLKEFCKKHKFNYGTMRLYTSGFARPSPEMALRIEKATGGKVDRLELLYPKAKD